MRHEHETATSFNQLKEITQAIQAQKRSVQTSANANASEITSQSTLKPKGATRTKNHALKPTKRAFSERQITTIRDKSSADKIQEIKQANHANAFESGEKNTRGQE
ncbi:hypothetical protein [Helicobacter pylori]|uniref:hypothetical protein n=1 Tax=Helicobacter pylori TaxID=210 RepID=UPI00115BEB85|nr:hypothetical protein [Helicobacter pylori]QDK11816.1 hypothetical protein D8X81_07435 [Helicobacter pylori]